MLQPLVLACLSLIATASADCTRDFLKNATDAYLAAQSGTRNALAPAIANNFTYTENDIPMSISNGILSQNLKIDHNLSIFDTTTCSTFTEIIVTDPAKPYVITTRMLFDNSRVTTMESIVTTNGDWAFNVTGFAYYGAMEDWSPIPAAKRDSRAVVKAVGDAYFDRFDNASVVVPWGAPCNRLEGGALVVGNLTGDDCVMAWPDTIKVTNRRYVVDEVLGAVDIYDGFPGLDASQPNTAVPDSHLFRVEGGKIKYIRTASHCIQRGCGMNGTVF